MTSVITPTSNTKQPKEKAISTITNATTYGIVADTDINNRTKRARWAKDLSANLGVAKVTLGDVSITNLTAGRYEYSGAEVLFHPSVKGAAREAGAPWFIRSAWLNRDMEIIAADVVSISDGEVFLWEAGQRGEAIPAWLLNKDGYQRRGYEVVYDLSAVFCDGDQLGYFKAAFAKRLQADAERAEHEERVAAAYEALKTNGENYHISYILRQAPEASVTSEESRANIQSALAGVEAAMVAELWEWVKASLGKLRCETSIRDRHGDPYGFVTASEVAYQIMYRWTENGFGGLDRAIRTAVAREFVRRHLS